RSTAGAKSRRAVKTLRGPAPDPPVDLVKELPTEAPGKTRDEPLPSIPAGTTRSAAGDRPGRLVEATRVRPRHFAGSPPASGLAFHRPPGRSPKPSTLFLLQPRGGQPPPRGFQLGRGEGYLAECEGDRRVRRKPRQSNPPSGPGRYRHQPPARGG